MTAAILTLLGMLDPSPAPVAPSLPGLPGVPVAPAGLPAWVVWIGYVIAALGTLGTGGVLVKLLDRRGTRANAERTEIEADEIFTKVAVTLVEPLRERLEQTEKRLTAAERRHAEERVELEREIVALRLRVREALTEADGAVAQASHVRRLVQQWHRAIMDPAATLEWLRTLVGPDEPAI
jgi:hypothetical protein